MSEQEDNTVQKKPRGRPTKSIVKPKDRTNAQKANDIKCRERMLKLHGKKNEEKEEKEEEKEEKEEEKIIPNEINNEHNDVETKKKINKTKIIEEEESEEEEIVYRKKKPKKKKKVIYYSSSDEDDDDNDQKELKKPILKRSSLEKTCFKKEDEIPLPQFQVKFF